MRRFFFFGFLLLFSFQVYAADPEVFPDPARFPLPDAYQPNVDFWTRVYGEWHDNQMVFHDAKNINIVFDVVDIPEENLLR